ncbi:MAG: ATP-grasp domain-containing protein, partial [Acidimicrobiales bacterium]
QLPPRVVSDAVRLAESIVAGLDATGLCAVEFFWTTDGRLLLNELALRPHNSGHATIEACATSQFHQHLRAVLDWPLGSTRLISPAATVNLIGGANGVDLSARLPAALSVPGAHVHLYAKTSRPGRKIGHVTALGATTEDALETARVAAALLTQP